MKTINKVYVILFFFSIASRTNVFAQDKKNKEALAMRIKEDQEFAQNQRWKYNDNAWKQSWEGTKLAELYKKWGTPTRSFSDGNNGQVVVYETISNYAGGTYTPGYSITTQTISGYVIGTETVGPKDTRWAVQYIHTTTVYADKEGVITKIDDRMTSNRSGDNK